MSKIVKPKKDVVKAIIGAIVVILLVDITPVGGNTLMYVNWARCGGHMPYQSGSTVYVDVPNYYQTTKIFSVFRGWPEYFCTPAEAEKAGYSADKHSYSFPHLTTQDERADAYRNARKIQNN